jgi:hypothetical protein
VRTRRGRVSLRISRSGATKGSGTACMTRLRAHVRRRAGRHKHATAGCLDSQSVKTAARPGPRGDDAGKHVTGRKRHVLVDTLGVVLVVVMTAAACGARAWDAPDLNQVPNSG